jgi:hypothetical protein
MIGASTTKPFSFDPSSDQLVPVYDPSSKVQTAKNFAEDIWTVTSWPEEDLAADVGWSVGWTIMLLGMLKVVSVGLHHEHKARPFFKRR